MPAGKICLLNEDWVGTYLIQQGRMKSQQNSKTDFFLFLDFFYERFILVVRLERYVCLLGNSVQGCNGICAAGHTQWVTPVALVREELAYVQRAAHSA